MKKILAAILLALLFPPPGKSAETVSAGGVGGPSATMWPYFVAIDKGFFRESGIELDIVYGSSSAGTMQQLAAGSLDIVASDGLAEPIHAIDRGADIAVLRIIGQSPPYALNVGPEIKSVRDLKGKTVSVGGRATLDFIYFKRIASGNGLEDGDYDLIVIGATGGRLAALQSGAVAGSILLPPFNFLAQDAGLPSVALAVDYASDLPFTGLMAFRAWAAKHPDVAKRVIATVGEGIAWFHDPANRAEAIAILAKRVKMAPEQIAASYDFLQKIHFFAPSDAVSKAQLTNLIQAMAGIGDISGTITADRIIMPGMTRPAD